MDSAQIGIAFGSVIWIFSLIFVAKAKRKLLKTAELTVLMGLCLFFAITLIMSLEKWLPFDIESIEKLQASLCFASSLNALKFLSIISNLSQKRQS